MREGCDGEFLPCPSAVMSGVMLMMMTMMKFMMIRFLIMMMMMMIMTTIMTSWGNAVMVTFSPAPVMSGVGPGGMSA